MTFGEGVRQSLATATLQNVEMRKPNSPASETFTILEKIFAPLQAALLALAIRRKFMRKFTSVEFAGKNDVKIPTIKK